MRQLSDFVLIEYESIDCDSAEIRTIYKIGTPWSSKQMADGCVCISYDGARLSVLQFITMRTKSGREDTNIFDVATLCRNEKFPVTVGLWTSDRYWEFIEKVKVCCKGVRRVCLYFIDSHAHIITFHDDLDTYLIKKGFTKHMQDE